MAIDAYSLCPGGTGKKIKFCCGDFLPELQKIDRMIDGEQFLACLQHVDHLLAHEPGRDRPCLLATKCMLLRFTDRQEAARTAAAAFLVKHPDNQIALAEMAILAAESNTLAALGLLQKAMRAANGDLDARTYQAMGLMAGSLLRAGFPLAAAGLLQLQCDITDKDDRAEEVLAALSQAIDVPLLLRDAPPLAPCPKDAPWAPRFDEAMQIATMGDWQTAAERLTVLAAEVPDSSVIWRDLAMLRGWLADNPGCIDALRRYAALRAGEEHGLEDAVEAEAMAMFLSPDPLGDRVEMLKLVWTVKDVERFQETLLSSPRWRTIPFNPAQFSDGENPPPKAAFMLLDRPMPESAESLDLHTVPNMLGQALLFGRQTDREARLEVLGVAADELPTVSDMVREAGGEAVEPEPNREVIGHWSASQKFLRAAWQPPRGASPDRLRAMMAEHIRDAILNRWPELKLGVLDDRSPHEAAADPACRTNLLAAILVLAQFTENLPGPIDYNELRAKLGLPTLAPIDPEQQPIGDLPVVRLMRVNVDGLSDEDLITAYYRAAGFNIRPALRKFAAAIAERPSMAESNERIHALGTLARTEEDISKALEYVNQGRRLTDKKKVSNVTWDLMELSFHFASHNGAEAMRLVEHIQKRHIEEPRVPEVLTRMLIDVGILNPDGTPAFAPESAEAPAMASEPSEPGGLWTPDSAQPGSGGGKLWTPE
jgi:tetratricopeptide (TPR) repeat protein